MNRFIKFLCLNALLLGSASLAMNGGDVVIQIDEEVTNYNPHMLCDAAFDGNVPLVKELLDAGIHVDAKGKKGNIPLRCAIICGNRRVCALLLAHKANLEPLNEQRETPLQLAGRMAWIDFRREMCNQIVDTLLEPIYNQKAAIALLGMKKFNKAACIRLNNKDEIQLIAHLIYKPVPIAKVLLKLFDQIDAIADEKIKEELLDYIKKQLEPKASQASTKASEAGAWCTIG